MNGKDIELSRRRVLGGIATVGAASAAAGAGTFAVFSDTETSEDNTVQAGTLDLGTTSTTTLSATNVTPGWNTDGEVTATYDSTSTVDPVNIDVSFSTVENDYSSTPTDADLQTDLDATQFGKKLRVDKASVNDGNGNSTDLTADVSPTTKTLADGDVSYIDLTQILGTHSGVLTSVSPGDAVTVELDLTLHTNTGNDAQADGVDIDVGITAIQP